MTSVKNKITLLCDCCNVNFPKCFGLSFRQERAKPGALKLQAFVWRKLQVLPSVRVRCKLAEGNLEKEDYVT